MESNSFNRTAWQGRERGDEQGLRELGEKKWSSQSHKRAGKNQRGKNREMVGRHAEPMKEFPKKPMKKGELANISQKLPHQLKIPDAPKM